jgi:hypothetical protein
MFGDESTAFATVQGLAGVQVPAGSGGRVIADNIALKVGSTWRHVVDPIFPFCLLCQYQYALPSLPLGKNDRVRHEG